jgi:hypothetical protein
VGLISQYLAQPLGEGRNLTSESAVVARELSGSEAEMLRRCQTAAMSKLAGRGGPTWAKLVRTLVDGGQCLADVVGQWVFGGQGVAASVDLDGAVAA